MKKLRYENTDKSAALAHLKIYYSGEKKEKANRKIYRSKCH